MNVLSLTGKWKETPAEKPPPLLSTLHGEREGKQPGKPVEFLPLSFLPSRKNIQTNLPLRKKFVLSIHTFALRTTAPCSPSARPALISDLLMRFLRKHETKRTFKGRPRFIFSASEPPHHSPLPPTCNERGTPFPMQVKRREIRRTISFPPKRENENYSP